MRIVWKDSSTTKRSKRYRRHTVFGIGNGWGISGDDNIYQTYNDAFNAIDRLLGGHSRYGKVNRHSDEIRIIGKINEQTKKEEGLL